jgi:hypothetical protein
MTREILIAFCLVTGCGSSRPVALDGSLPGDVRDESSLCPLWQTVCNEECVNTSADPDHCGVRQQLLQRLHVYRRQVSDFLRDRPGALRLQPTSHRL